MSGTPMTTGSFFKTVATLPEELAPNAIYLVRTGFGFDIYATDSSGMISHKHNGISEKYFQQLAPTNVARGRALSILVPYLFNTKNGNNWNTGFAKILEGVKKHKLLKFYPILDLLIHDTLPEANAKEAVAVLNGCGATPLVYIKLNESVSPSVIRDNLQTLYTKYGSRIGVYLHVAPGVSIDKFILNTISIEMSKKLMYPLVVYTENVDIPINGAKVTESLFNLEGLVDNTCGDIFIQHNTVGGADDVVYATNSTQPYPNKGMIVYGCTIGNVVKLMLDKYNTISTICLSSATTIANIHTSTLPSYFEQYLLECTNYVTRFESIITSELVGSVTYFASENIPNGWLICNGSAISRSVYGRLFEVIGTTYGEGDGTTTFNLPDVRGVFLRGLDLGRGIDIDRAAGELQQDGVAYHVHLASTYLDSDSECRSEYKENIRRTGVHRYMSSTLALITGTDSMHYTSTCGGNTPIPFVPDTRPLNLAMYPCIKY